MLECHSRRAESVQGPTNEMIYVPSSITTSRLILRMAQPGNAKVLHARYFSDPICSRYLRRQPHQTVRQSGEVLRRFTRPNAGERAEHRGWVIALKETNVPIGLLLLFRLANAYELHFGISRAY